MERAPRAELGKKPLRAVVKVGRVQAVAVVLTDLAPHGVTAQSLGLLAGSFSAVSKRNFARKYAFDSIFQALQDLHIFAPLQSQNFRKKSV